MFSFLLSICLGEELVGHMVTLCLHLFGEPQIVFHYRCTILPSCQQCMRLLVFPHLQQHLLLSAFLILVTLVGVKWCLIIVLICISLLANDVDHFCPFLSCFLKNYYWLILRVLDTGSLSDIWFANIFSHPVGCLFSFLTVSFEAQKF